MILIGIIAVTLVFLYPVTLFGLFAFCAFAGIDEYNPKAGIVCTIIALAFAAAWWYLVGQHIHFHVAFN